MRSGFLGLAQWAIIAGMTKTADRRQQYNDAIWQHCQAKPGAVEDHPWGDTVFKINDKVFAFLGTPERPGATVKAPPDELEVLLLAPFIARSKYIGRYGWITVRVENKNTLKLALDLIDDSYEIIESRRRRPPRSKS